MAIRKFLKFSFLYCCISISKSQTITLFKEAYANEEKLELSVDNCTSLLPDFLGKIACGNFTVGCAKFYDSEDCKGNSVEIQRDSLKNHSWELLDIQSIGPCEIQHPACKENESERFTNPYISQKKFGIELFEQEDFKGRSVAGYLQWKICYEVPRAIKRKISSIRTFEDVCIQLHEQSSCSNDGQIIRINAPTGVINLAQWGFNDKTSSISLCNYNCNKFQSKNKRNFASTSDLEPQCPHITLFDEEDFKGNSRHVVVMDKCENIIGEWEGSAESIRLYQECVIIYNNFDCEEKKEKDSKFLSNYARKILLQKSKNQSSIGFNLQDYNMTGYLRSVGPCVKISPAHRFISVYLLVGLFLSGIFIAGCVNSFVRKRDHRERQIRIYHDKPI